ncbi:hypothetical protein B9Q04_11990 [Candidatus Marsarchaeota G2 archaeon BE_D]|jgi:hypothetical protein|uniref:Uncharacterized protein n=1 Tax=Candidatus Marsarchaeota G2 archaeon BE_D TaxID=1978158 RepID=A0A2R6C8J9_9ARCH|nr:MAG: hypothetical protein B9Q04_11990 [Candidatus Marsarchaeota G2 archaeon BE_D]
MAADPAWDEMWVYEHLSEYAASLIHKYYEPCGLRHQLLKEIYRIIESERCIPLEEALKANIIWMALKRGVNWAESMSEKSLSKSMCDYLYIDIYTGLRNYIKAFPGGFKGYNRTT